MVWCCPLEKPPGQKKPVGYEASVGLKVWDATLGQNENTRVYFLKSQPSRICNLHKIAATAEVGDLDSQPKGEANQNERASS